MFQSCHRHLPQLLQPLQMSLLPQQNRHMLNRSGGFVISVKIEDLETFQKKLNSTVCEKMRLSNEVNKNQSISVVKYNQ